MAAAAAAAVAAAAAASNQYREFEDAKVPSIKAANALHVLWLLCPAYKDAPNTTSVYTPIRDARVHKVQKCRYIPVGTSALYARSSTIVDKTLPSEAIPFVRSRMAGEEPFPTNKEQLSSVLQGALLDSHREHSVIANREIPEGTDFLVTFAEFWLLLSSIRVINVELQGLARKLVKKHYGFEDPETTANAGAASTRNKNMVPVLLRSSSRYMFHGRQDDSDRVSPLTSRQYLHPILEEFVLRAWFDQGSNSAGFRAPRRFDIGGVPLTTIAFVMSVIAAAVSEWSTGSCEPVDFLIHPGLAIKQNFHNSHTTLKLWEEQLLQSNSPVTYSALRTSMLQNVISDRRGAAASSDRRAR